MAKGRETANVDVVINGVEAQKRVRELTTALDEFKAKKREALKGGDLGLAAALDKELGMIRKDLKQYKADVVNVEHVLGNLNKVSLRDLQKAKQSLRKDIQGLNQDSDEFLDKVEKLKKVESQINSINGNMSQGASSWGKMASAVFGGNLLTKAAGSLSELITKGKEFIVQGIEMAAKTQGIKTAFDKLDDPNLLKDLRKNTRGTVSDLQLMQSAVSAKNLNIPLEHFGKLLKFAQQRAQETGESVDYLVDSIVKGLGRKSALILDNLGLSAVRIQSEAKKTGDFMTAAIGIINEELEKQGDLVLTDADKKQQAAVKWENAQLAVGQRFVWLGGLWNEISGGIADSIEDLAGDMRTATKVYDDQIATVAELERNTFVMAQRYDELTAKSELSVQEQKELDSIMKTLSHSAIPGVVLGFDDYGNALSINTEKIYEFIEAEKARLEWMNKSAIADQERELKKNRDELTKVQDKLTSGKTTRTSMGSSITGASVKLDDLTPKEIKNLNAQKDELAKNVLGIESEIKRLNGTTIEEQGKAYKEMADHRDQFNSLTKEQLAAWIADGANANNKYLDDAKKTYSRRFTGGGDSGDEKDKPSGSGSSWSLQKDEQYMSARLELRRQMLEGELSTEEEYKSQLLDLEIAALDRRIQANQEKGSELQDLQLQLADKRYEKQKNEQQRLEKLIAASLEASDNNDVDRLVEIEKMAYEKRRRELGLFGKDREQMTAQELAAIENLERNHTAKLQKIYMDHTEKEFKQDSAAMQRSISQLKIEHNEELLGADSFAKKKAILAKVMSEDQLRNIRTDKQANRALEEYYRQIEQEEARKHLTALLEKYEQYMVEARKIGEDGAPMFNDEEAARLQQIIDDLRKQLAELRGITPTDDTKDSDVDILGFTPDTWERFFTHLDEGKLKLEEWEMALGLVGQAFGQISALMAAAEQREFKEFEKTANKKKKTLDAQLKSGQISQSKYADQVQELDNQVDKKRAELERKQAARQKTLAIFEALVNTAVGISAALKIAPPMGIILAGIVGALGAIQVATIASTPLPGAEDGGYLDVTRSQDGKKFRAKNDPDARGYIPDTSVIVSEAGEEYVVKANAVRNPTVRPVLDAIDIATRNGTVGSINLLAVIASSIPGRSSGGFVNHTGTSSNNISPDVPAADSGADGEVLRKVYGILEKLDKRLDEPIQAYTYLTGKGGINDAQEKYNRIRKSL